MSTSISRIDAPPPVPAEPAEPAPNDGWRSGGLPALRAELDRIDNTIHDLLMERAATSWTATFYDRFDQPLATCASTARPSICKALMP